MLYETPKNRTPKIGQFANRTIKKAKKETFGPRIPFSETRAASYILQQYRLNFLGKSHFRKKSARMFFQRNAIAIREKGAQEAYVSEKWAGHIASADDKIPP